jgi:protein phosphatase
VAIRVIAAGRSDVGLQREHNEDSFALLDRHVLYVVADGMGGHQAGDVASKMATETLSAFFDSTAREDATWPFHYDPSLSTDENRLMTGIKVANKTIYEESARNAAHRGMGTTFVGVLISTTLGKTYVAHVGDSRCYRIRDGAITQLTQDHSLINEYLRAMPHLSQAQRDELPRNVITRALGMTEGVLVDLAEESPVPGDFYLLCSDGLSGMISDEEMLQIVTDAPSLRAACEALINLANHHGGEDNITAVLLKITDADVPDEPTTPDATVTETRPIDASVFESSPPQAETGEAPAAKLPE